MRNTSEHFAALVSSNAVEFPFPYNGGSHLHLELRNGEKGSRFGLDAMLTIEKGQFDCGIDGCAVAMKFDGGTVERWGMTPSAGLNSKTIFFSSAGNFVARVRKAKKLVIEATFFQSGARQFIFNLPALPDDALGPPKPAAKPAAATHPTGGPYCFHGDDIAYCYAELRDCEMKQQSVHGDPTPCVVTKNPPCSWGLYEDNCHKILLGSASSE